MLESVTHWVSWPRFCRLLTQPYFSVYEEIDNQYDPAKQTSRDVIVKYVYYLSNPQKESLITVTSVGTVLAATPITFAYNNMGFR